MYEWSVKMCVLQRDRSLVTNDRIAACFVGLVLPKFCAGLLLRSSTDEKPQVDFISLCYYVHKVVI